MNLAAGDAEPDFNSFVSTLIGLPVSHIWRGYGSAIFLEFGALSRGRTRRDGSAGNPRGEWTLMIEWSWRVEGKRRIWCGSSSEKERWPRAFAYLMGANVKSVSLCGRLPEISLDLSNGLHVLSMMTAEGDPEWGLIHRLGSDSTSIGVRAGRLHIDTRPISPKEAE
jgi:hypothetical protein